MNIEQMTQKTREALQAAQRIAVEYSNNAVEQEHLLAALASSRTGSSRRCCRPLALTPMPCPGGLAEGGGAAPRDRLGP